MKRFIAAMSVVALAACTTADPNVISRYDAQRMSQVQDATVLSVRPVTVEGNQSGIGGASGAVVGGVAGSSVGGSREGFVIGVLGAVAGAVVGNAVERNATKENAVEVTVQLRNGERRAIVQGRTDDAFAPGEPVELVTTGSKTRVRRVYAQPPLSRPVPAAG